MFDTLPKSFFSLLVSKNRDLYVGALFTLRKAIRQDLYITREDLAKRIAISLEDEMNNASFIENEDLVDDEEDFSNPTSKALYVIRKLRDFGWINIDFNAKNSLEEYIAVPAYATAAINFLYGLTSEEEEEYNSLVYSTYASLKIADTDNNDYFDALLTAFKNTDKLNESLANLYYGIRSIEQRIADNIDINDVASIHFNEYLLRLHDKFYHPYKTFDSIERFRMPILRLIKKWQNDASVRKKIMEAIKNKNAGKKSDELYEKVVAMYDFIYQIYDEVDDKMSIIDDKINDYTASTIDKMKHLVNLDESFKGKLVSISSFIVKYKEHADDIVEMFQDKLVLQCQENATKDGLYNKREMTPIDITDTPEIIFIDKEGDDVDEIKNKLVQGYNLGRIKDFILSKANGKLEITMRELNIANDEDFILSILAMIRSDEKELPFDVVFTDGYFRVKNYLVPDIKFIIKGVKK